MAGNEVVATIREVIEWAALLIEILGAIVIVAGVIRVVVTRGTIRCLIQIEKPGVYESYKHQLGKPNSSTVRTVSATNAFLETPR